MPDNIELEVDDEKDPKKRKAKLRNVRVNFVSLVDDGAVPNAYWKVIKNKLGESDLSDVNNDNDVDSVDAVIASESESSIEIEELQSRVSELTSLVESMTETLEQNSDSFKSLVETVSSLQTEMTSKEEESVVESENSTDDGPEISIVESEQEEESVITPEMLESLSEITAEMNERYSSGDISDEEFDSFNSEIENLLSEVA